MILNENELELWRHEARLLESEKEYLTKTKPDLKNNSEYKSWLNAFNFTSESLNRINNKITIYEVSKMGKTENREILELEDIGEYLISARIERGWSQEKLANELGISELKLVEIERSLYRQASFLVIIKVSKLLHVKLQGMFVCDSIDEK